MEGVIAGRILTPFAAIALAADAIHGDSQHLVCLSGKGTQAHAACAKAAADAFDALNLVQGQWGWGGREFQ